jgi:N-acetylmuramoyl-L-alanine amidase-like protein/flagellar hook capping protein FlgD
MKWVTALAAAAALLVPAAARAGDVVMRVEALPAGQRAPAAASAAIHFNMLAFTWAGSGTVEFRVRRLSGRWRGWQQADDDVMWAGGSDAFRVRRRGDVRRLHAYELWSRVTSAPRALASAAQPAIVARAQWGADEEIVRAKPVYATSVKLAVVHHTVTPNTYTRAQAAAIVRGIEFFHVRGNGWNDIGYNFLVDRFGTVYEGRAGGIDRNVVGAHAAGFNTGTVGVSLLGTFQRVAPSRPMQNALVSLLAWRLDVAHVDPLSTSVYTSGGNAKFRRGKLVTLHAVSGHRDTGPTECPGTDAYRLLPSLARRVAATGLPKLYGPVAAGALGGPVRFQARLSTVQPWTVTVVDGSGSTVASGAGRSKLVDWTWRAPPLAKGGYTWTIAAPGARSATGTLGRPAPPPAASLMGVGVDPSILAPAADGTIAPPTVAYELTTAATVTVRVVDTTGTTARAFSLGVRPAGRRTVRFDASALPDGRYQVAVTASAGGASVTRWADMVVDRTVAGFTSTPRAFSPNHDLAFDSTTFSFLLAAPAQVRLEIRSGDAVVAAPFAAALPAGPSTVAWDGSGFAGPLPDGTYQAVLTVTDRLGDVPVATAVVVDTTPPQLQLLDRSMLLFSLDEPATVTAIVNGATTIVRQQPAGTFAVPFQGTVTSVTAQAVDAAGNASASVSG